MLDSATPRTRYNDPAGDVDEADEGSNEAAAQTERAPVDTLYELLKHLGKNESKGNDSIFSDLKRSVMRFKEHASDEKRERYNEMLTYARGCQGYNIEESDEENLAVTLNMTYAVTDALISSSLPTNPKVSARPLNRIALEAKGLLDAHLDAVFVKNRMRRRAADVLFDAITLGYGIFKTTWDSSSGMAKIESRRAAHTFFDLSTREPADVRWFVDAEAVPVTALYGLLRTETVDADGVYNFPEINRKSPEEIVRDIWNKAGPHPSWMTDKLKREEDGDIFKCERWVTVWRFYDKVVNKYVVYVEEADIVLHDGVLLEIPGHGPYMPFTIVTMSLNGVTTEGVGDVKVMFPFQKILDRMGTLANQVMHAQVPIILADGSQIDAAAVTTANEAPAGSVVLMEPRKEDNGVPPGERFRNAFYEKPTPAAPAAVLAYIETIRNYIGVTTTVGDLQRGMLANARTATEVEVLKSNNQTKLGTRQMFMDAGFEDVAYKVFILTQDRAQDDLEMFVRTSGVNPFTTVKLAASILKSSMAIFEMNMGNPLRENPMVALEALHNILPVIMNTAPKSAVPQILKYILTMIGAPVELVDAVAQTPVEPEPGAQEMPGSPDAGPEGAGLPGGVSSVPAATTPSLPPGAGPQAPAVPAESSNNPTAPTPQELGLDTNIART